MNCKTGQPIVIEGITYLQETVTDPIPIDNVEKLIRII